MLVELSRSQNDGLSKNLPAGVIGRSQLEIASRLAEKGFIDDCGSHYVLSPSGRDEADGLWQLRILEEIRDSLKYWSVSTELSIALGLDDKEVMRHLTALDQLRFVVLQPQVNFWQVRINDAGTKYLRECRRI